MLSFTCLFLGSREEEDGIVDGKPREIDTLALRRRCCSRPSSLTVVIAPPHILALYRAYPANLKMQDALQRTCLHYLVANGSKISTLKLLLNEFPEAAAVVDHRNWLPLHIAAGMRAPLIVIQLLLEKNPTAVLVLDEDGHSPLALAKRDVIPKRAVDDNVVLFLENAMKEQLKKRGGTDMEEIMIAPVPNIIRVAGDTATDAVSASGVSKASTLSTKVASGSTSSSSSSLKKGLFRRRR